MTLHTSVRAILFVLPVMVFAHGALQEKIDHLKAEIAMKPDDAALRCQLAGVYSEHGDWLEALAEIDRAEALAPNCDEVHLLRGEALLAERRPAEAKLSLDRFLGVHHDHSHALRLRARALGALKQIELSLADYRASLRIGEPEPDLVLESADALNANGHADEAIKVLLEAIARKGANPALIRRTMELEAATGDFDSALKRIDQLQTSAPRPEPWMAKRASLLAKAGRVAEARAAWESLITHLSALPNLERGSKPMRLLDEQARQALASP